MHVFSGAWQAASFSDWSNRPDGSSVSGQNMSIFR